MSGVEYRQDRPPGSSCLPPEWDPGDCSTQKDRVFAQKAQMLIDYYLWLREKSLEAHGVEFVKVTWKPEGDSQ